MTTVTELREGINRDAARQRKALTGFARRFPDIWNDVEFFNEQHGVTSYVGYLYGGTFDIRVDNLDGFKEAKLLDILAFVESKYRVEFTCVDKPAARCKEFAARTPWDGGTLDIYVHANLAMDSKGCTRIVVSVRTETIEVPEYRLECHETD